MHFLTLSVLAIGLTSVTATDPTQCPVSTPPPPPSNDGYTLMFSNITGATEANDYMTFSLVPTVDDCKAFCNRTAGCGFANSYNDVNGKGGSPLLTCSLYSTCHTIADANNRGGQTQSDSGLLDFILNSDGWCKN